LFLLAVPFVKLIYTAAGIDYFLFARVERVAFVADFHLNGVAFFDAACGKTGAACATRCYFVVVGVYSLFHDA